MITFYKMSGSGNDFIIIDLRNRMMPIDDLPLFAARVCRRKLSVGADGLILLEKSDRADFKWQFFNSDGSVAEMCGNGARCAARFALLNGIAPSRMTFETLAGIITAEVIGDQVKIQMTEPFDLKIDFDLALQGQHLTYSSINTGVPHVVIEVDDLEITDVVQLGRSIRQHADFAPAGTNVNFISPAENGHWAIRTYERGVEDETLACGPGLVAAALTLSARCGLASPVTFRTRSGSLLKVHFDKSVEGFGTVLLEGDARVIYHGDLNSEAWLY